MTTEPNFMEHTEKEHQYLEEIDTDEPICVAHLNVMRSEDIEVIEGRPSWSLIEIKNERHTDWVNVKLEPVQDHIEKDEITIVENENQVHIQTYTHTSKVTDKDVKKKRSDKDDFERLISGEVVMKELIEEVNLVEYDKSEENLKQNKSLQAASRKHKSKNFKVTSLLRKLLLDGKKPFKCKICQESFTRKLSVDRHLLIHTGEKPFKCKVCKRRFNDKGNMTKHYQLHTGQGPYCCGLCEKRFTRKDRLDVHLKTHEVN